MARNIECQCTERFTCGYCLRNAPPALYTPRTWAEVLHEQIWRKPTYLTDEQREQERVDAEARLAARTPEQVAADEAEWAARARTNFD